MTELAKTMAFEFGPGDLLAEVRPEQRLVGSAGEAPDAAERLMHLHEFPAGGRKLRRTPEQLRVNEIHGADVQRRRHANATAEVQQMLDEIEADLAMVQATVDVGTGDRDEPLGPECLAGSPQEVHGEGSRRPTTALQKILVFERQQQTLHPVLSRARSARKPQSRVELPIPGL